MQCPECQGIGTIIEPGFDELLYCPGPGGRIPCPTCKGEKTVTVPPPRNPRSTVWTLGPINPCNGKLHHTLLVHPTVESR